MITKSVALASMVAVLSRETLAQVRQVPIKPPVTQSIPSSGPSAPVPTAATPAVPRKIDSAIAYDPDIKPSGRGEAAAERSSSMIGPGTVYIDASGSQRYVVRMNDNAVGRVLWWTTQPYKASHKYEVISDSNKPICTKLVTVNKRFEEICLRCDAKRREFDTTAVCPPPKRAELNFNWLTSK